jgi:DNA polymerase-3 subunit epsilon
MLREIVLDTETTGTDAKGGDRLIEVGCVELLNHIRTGKTFHRFVNPQRPVSEGAFAVHGLSDAFLADKPLLADVIDDFLDFCGDARLVIHNAAFDVGFLNMEYARLKPSAPQPIALDNVVDTLILARRRHPGAANNLDALCNRYGIDNTKRTKHGALLDAEILADVYIELLGGKQTSLGLNTSNHETEMHTVNFATHEPNETTPLPSRTIRTHLTEDEQRQHAAFIGTLAGNAVWKDYLDDGTVD